MLCHQHISFKLGIEHKDKDRLLLGLFQEEKIFVIFTSRRYTAILHKVATGNMQMWKIPMQIARIKNASTVKGLETSKLF